MHETNHIPPERLTPEQRRHEVASCWRRGWSACAEAATEQSERSAGESAFVLGFASQTERS